VEDVLIARGTGRGDGRSWAERNEDQNEREDGCGGSAVTSRVG
jgi:hypothetical protein